MTAIPDAQDANVTARAESDRDTDRETKQVGTVGLVRQSNPRLSRSTNKTAGRQESSAGHKGYPRRPEALPAGDAGAKAQG